MEEKLIVIVRSNVAKKIKELGFNMSSVTPTALNDVVLDLIEKATERAKLNKRKTIFPQDF